MLTFAGVEGWNKENGRTTLPQGFGKFSNWFDTNIKGCWNNIIVVKYLFILFKIK